MSFANGLGMLRQTQHHLQSDNYLLVGAQLYDYCGRPALQSLSAPVNQEYFSYQSNLITSDAAGNGLYRAKDFDATDNYDNPSRILGGDITEYYSDLNPDLSIPNSEGYPFGRTLYKPYKRN